MFSKKILAFLSVVVLFAGSLSVVTFAAGVDDGVISVTTKNSKRYIGAETTMNFIAIQTLM